MRLKFDTFSGDDHEAAAEARDALVERFATWVEGRADHKDAEPSDVELLLDWKFGYGDGDYGWWARQDIDEFLLEHLPRKLTAPPDLAASIPPSVAAFVTFLDDEGLLTEESDPAPVLVTRSRAQQRAFLDAMADPSNFGMAKRLVSSGFGDGAPGDGLGGALGGMFGGDLPDQEALDEAIARFNELPFEQRGQVLGFGEPEGPPAGHLVQLPLITELDEAALDRAAADVPLLRQVDALHAALKDSPAKLTKTGQLTLAEGRRLVAATGVDDRVEGIRSSAELGRLFGVVKVALQAGAAEVDGSRLRPAPGWTDRTAGARWQEVGEAVLVLGAATLAFGAHAPSPLHLADDGDHLAYHMLAMLWVAPEPLPVAAFVGLMHEVTGTTEVPSLAQQGFGRAGDLLSTSDIRRSICKHRTAEVVRSLEQAGLVIVNRSSAGGDRADGEGERAPVPSAGDAAAGDSDGFAGPGAMPLDAEAEGTTLSLTEAAVTLVSDELESAGYDVLREQEVAQLDGGGLLDLMAERPDEPEIVPCWLRAHPGPEGVAEVGAALPGEPDPVRTLLAFTVLGEFGDAAVDTLRGLLDGPFAGHAWMQLAALGEAGHDEMPDDALAAAGVDLFLATSEVGSPADVIEMILGSVPADEHQGFIDRLAARSDHDRTGELLELIGRHHPDRATAKHARKSAHRWRSAHGRRRGL